MMMMFYQPCALSQCTNFDIYISLSSVMLVSTTTLTLWMFNCSFEVIVRARAQAQHILNAKDLFILQRQILLHFFLSLLKEYDENWSEFRWMFGFMLTLSTLNMRKFNFLIKNQSFLPIESGFVRNFFGHYAMLFPHLTHSQTNKRNNEVKFKHWNEIYLNCMRRKTPVY